MADLRRHVESRSNVQIAGRIALPQLLGRLEVWLAMYFRARVIKAAA